MFQLECNTMTVVFRHFLSKKSKQDVYQTCSRIQKLLYEVQYQYLTSS